MKKSTNNNHCAITTGAMLEAYFKVHFADKTGLLIAAEDMSVDEFFKLKSDLAPYGYDPRTDWEYEPSKNSNFANPRGDFGQYFVFVEMPKSAATRMNIRYSENNDTFLSAPVVNGEITNRKFRAFFSFLLVRKRLEAKPMGVTIRCKKPIGALTWDVAASRGCV